MNPKILITGASGFIGSFIVEEAIKRGFDVWAAMRKSSSRQFLADDRIQFIELNLASEEDLKQQLAGHSFDYVVHAAGVTKCLDKQDFFRINTEGTQHLVRALLELNMPLKRFVYISSLSIMGAIREEQPYQEIRESDEARPNTAYGESKLEAEQWLDSVCEELKAKQKELQKQNGCFSFFSHLLNCFFDAFKGFNADIMFNLAGVFGSNCFRHTDCNQQICKHSMALINTFCDLAASRLKNNSSVIVYFYITFFFKIMNSNTNRRT